MIETNLSFLFKRLAAFDDHLAFKELHENYYQKLYCFVHSKVNSRECAEEIVNDVFVTIWQRRSRLEEVVKPEIYLFVCARNQALKHLRAQGILPVKQLEELQDFPSGPEKSPMNILLTGEMVHRINKAVELLPPKCKTIFLLVKEEHLKYREVARILNVSEKTVENQMSIALKKLSNFLSCLIIVLGQNLTFLLCV